LHIELTQRAFAVQWLKGWEREMIEKDSQHVPKVRTLPSRTFSAYLNCFTISAVGGNEHPFTRELWYILPLGYSQSNKDF
jgi:hypothetical protein